MADHAARLSRHRLMAVGRSLLRIALILALVWGIHALLNWANTHVPHGRGALRLGMLLVFLLAYAALIAVPFVPGIEIGLSLMIIEGPWIAPPIYLATVTGLLLAYAAGEWLPYRVLHQMLSDLGMRRACALLDRAHPLSRDERLLLLQARAPAWLRPFVSRFRYVLLAVLVNMPGNALVGGGGGILFVAGFSRLFRPLPTAGTIALAVLPVPLLIWVFEIDPRGLLG
jgi:hypothetical protein